MQQLNDIFGIWISIDAMASDLGEKPDTVYRWKKRQRIPETAWAKVIERAALKEVLITIAQLHTFNTTPKLRGRPAHKPSDATAA